MPKGVYIRQVPRPPYSLKPERRHRESGERNYDWRKVYRVASAYGISTTGTDRAVRDRVQRQMMVRILREMRKFLGCSECGYSRSALALHFHHRDPSQKRWNIGSQVSRTTMSWPPVIEEVQKCDIVCANCHYELEEKGFGHNLTSRSSRR